ncbi:MAG TPA: hypothetical protein VLK25_09060 [Allosphingosinicella sp.]|nr:hypothetical protein [Allosphingosinicella sp.]
MRPFKSRPPLKGGLDTVGPFHPYLAYAGVILANLAGLLIIVAALTWIGDRLEDLLWPGGPEWVEF